MKSIAIDFDGVIHAYSRGWADGSIYDPPVPGALDAIWRLLGYYNVFIFSARPAWQIQAWLAKEDKDLPTAIIGEERFWSREGVVGITNRKLPAEFYIDDRGIRFKDWPSTLATVFVHSGLFAEMRQAVEKVNPSIH